jgi:hypothetical protein
MLRLVNGLRELGLDNKGYVDCYVSCDAGETETIIEGLGYHQSPDRESVDSSLLDLYIELDGSVCRLRYHNKDTVIDCVGVPSDEDIRQRKNIGKSGFPSQSKIRIYYSSNQVERRLIQVAKAFSDNQQNFAFVNPEKNTAYVKLDRGYEWFL